MKKGFILILVVVALLTALFMISRSTTFQLFGEIYPRVETNQKAVALTFDDGPNPQNNEKILQMLKEESVKATFYLTGAEIEKHQGETEKIIALGHEVGNHSFSHTRMVLVSPSFVKNEIEKTDALIRQSGYEGEITFRPPYGKKLFVLPWYLSQNERKSVIWDVEPEKDYDKSEEMVKYAVENTRSGSIILLHVMYDSRAESLKAVRPLIRELRQKGFEFKTVSELLALQ
jgi:peptidoglycan-N-acetylglucosamine deacetylase